MRIGSAAVLLKILFRVRDVSLSLLQELTQAEVFMPDAPMGIGATFFAVGSTIFSYLLLRGRMVPVPIAWLGVLSSALFVVLLPLQFIGVSGIVTPFLVMWMPVLVFELSLACGYSSKARPSPASDESVSSLPPFSLSVEPGPLASIME